MAPFADDVNIPQFSSDLACEAAQIKSATLKNWISRTPSAVLVGDEERIPAGQQRASYRFTLRRVLQLAITAELVRLNIPPREASLFAAGFTDFEDGGSSNSPTRKRGELYRKHYTLMIISAETPHASIENVKAEEVWRVIMRKGIGAPRPTSAIVININEIDARVRMSLGLPILAREGVR